MCVSDSRGRTDKETRHVPQATIPALKQIKMYLNDSPVWSHQLIPHAHVPSREFYAWLVRICGHFHYSTRNPFWPRLTRSMNDSVQVDCHPLSRPKVHRLNVNIRAYQHISVPAKSWLASYNILPEWCQELFCPESSRTPWLASVSRWIFSLHACLDSFSPPQTKWKKIRWYFFFASWFSLSHSRKHGLVWLALLTCNSTDRRMEIWSVSQAIAIEQVSAH